MNSRMRNLVGASILALAAAACSSPEQRVEKYYASGIEFLDEGDLGRANVQFQNVLKIDDQHVPTLIGVAKIAEERKDFQAMFGILQKVVRIDPENVGSLAKLGKLHLLSSDETEALDLAERALAIEPQNIEALTLKAAVLSRLGDDEKAVEIAENVLGAQPGNAEATSVIAAALTKAGDLDGALSQIDSALEMNPKQAALQLLRIQILERQERSEDVETAVKNLTELFPEEPVYKRTYAAQLLSKKDYEGAIAELEGIVTLLPNELDAKLDVIRVANVMSGPEAAEAKFREYLNSNPTDVQLALANSDFYLRENDAASAADVVRPFTASPDASTANLARNRLAEIDVVLGNDEQARKIFEDILQSDAGNVQALIGRAKLKVDDGDADGAIADLRNALNNDPENFQAMVVQAAAYKAQGNRDAARAELAKAFNASNSNAGVGAIYGRFLLEENNPQRAADILEQSLREAGPQSENLRLLAQARLQLQDWQGAEEVADIIQRLDEGSDNDDYLLTIRSAALSGSQDYQGVINLLEPSESDRPLAASPLALLTNAYISSGKTDEATNMLAGVLESDPENYSARLQLARVYTATGDTEKMRATLMDAIDEAPSRPEAYINLYGAYLRSGDRSAANAIIDQAAVAAPDSNAIKVYKADKLLSEGKKDEALKLYDELIDTFSSNALVVNNYISLTTELRDDSSAIQNALQYADAVKDIDNPNMKDTIGWAYFKVEDLSSALAYLKQASEGAPDNAEILYHYGAALLAAGEIEAGVETLENALAAGDDAFAYVDEVQSLLAQQ